MQLGNLIRGCTRMEQCTSLGAVSMLFWLGTQSLFTILCKVATNFACVTIDGKLFGVCTMYIYALDQKRNMGVMCAYSRLCTYSVNADNSVGEQMKGLILHFLLSILPPSLIYFYFSSRLKFFFHLFPAQKAFEQKR